MRDQVKVTGERVSTTAGAFNPTFQRHRAAYRAAAEQIGPGRVLDLGCGTGHSVGELAPRESIGVDIDAASLDGQPRETVVADLRDTPFDDESFPSVVCIHAIEHVPDPDKVGAEAARVLEPGGVAVLVTPNRLTFARADEIVDPYHEVEMDQHEFRAAVDGAFAEVEMLGLFGSERYGQFVAREAKTLDRLLAIDRPAAAPPRAEPGPARALRHGAAGGAPAPSRPAGGRDHRRRLLRRPRRPRQVPGPHRGVPVAAPVRRGTPG